MKTTYFAVAMLGLAAVAGCEKPYVAEFEPNMVHAYRVSLAAGTPMDQALSETETAMERLFGTPDDPKLPEFIKADEELESLVSIDHLMAASGSPTDAGRGLYRQHCSTCHGITGNGRGTTAALLDPYPRDYRMGKFKFKSTAIGSKPTREDLAYLIKHGVQGTAMKAIPELNENPANIEALIDYVIYLSWRGEVERLMLDEAEFIAFDEGEALYNDRLVNMYLSQYQEDVDPESIQDEAKREEYETFVDQWEFVQDITIEVAESWLDAADEVSDIAQPQDVVVGESIDEVAAAVESPEDSPLKQSVMRGRELFVSEKAACAKCHGKEGYGDGQNNDFDAWAADWAPDWVQQAKQDPKAAADQSSLIPLIARGVLPPRNIVPRDFREGMFRGGAEPEHLYHRIRYGIDGTPMPAATLESDQIWDLVNYVRSLRQAEPTTDQPAPEAKPTESVSTEAPADDQRSAG